MNGRHTGVATLPRGRLVLIFGMPRSGTTWLGKIFDSHPDTVYYHEPDTFPRLECLPRYPAPGEAERYRGTIRGFIDELPRLNDAAVVAKTPLFRKSWRRTMRHQVFRGSALAAKAGEKAHLHLPVLCARSGTGQSVPVWKSIESLGRFGLLMHSLPRAVGIHLVRHPCGQINSVLRGERQAAFRDNAPTSEYYRLFEKLLESPPAKKYGLSIRALQRLTPEERLAWHWVLANEKAIDDTAEMSRVRLVRYEDLCDDPAATAFRLFEFTGLWWNRQTRTFVHQSTHLNNARYYSVFKTPAHTAARWRHELAPESADRILAIVGQSALAGLYGPEQAAVPAAG